MKMKLAYAGRSGLQSTPSGRLLSLMPNLARDRVAFDAALRQPLRFREAMSALHDVVINDLRYKPRDKTAYQQWKQQQQRAEREQYVAAYHQARTDILAKRQDVPPDLEQQYNKYRREYWKVRQKYSNYLLRHQTELWRMLMPCDPVITVAEDVVFFECFSADESSYGCLSVERDGGFVGDESAEVGTTNVDYTWDLYHHFQSLRSYRQTRLKVDPSGFEVATEDNPEYREEKIDLPPSWLQGFVQIQSAMTLPMQKITLSRETVYSLLGFLKRHKAKTSPRAIRFELLPGKPIRLVLEPWEQEIVDQGRVYDGPETEPIRVWGRNRLLVLARTLPLAESFDVYLLGTGLPSFWTARMGEMRLTVGLSGWTTNDWTRSSALSLLAPPIKLLDRDVDQVADHLHAHRSGTLLDIATRLQFKPEVCAAALNKLASFGQVIFDLQAKRYRWRQIMPQALGESELGTEHPEMIGCRKIMERRSTKINSCQPNEQGLHITGLVDGCQTSIQLDSEGRIRAGECVCSYYREFGLRAGPCRHMLALRWKSQQAGEGAETWVERFQRLLLN